MTTKDLEYCTHLVDKTAVGFEKKNNSNFASSTMDKML